MGGGGVEVVTSAYIVVRRQEVDGRVLRMEGAHLTRIHICACVCMRVYVCVYVCVYVGAS